MIVEELITLLKFDTAGIEKAKKFDQMLEKINDHAKGIAAAVTAAVAAIGYFAQSVAKETADNYEWAKSVGIASDTFQRFDQVASLFGGNLDDMKDDLASWSRYAKKSGQSVEEVFLREARRIQGMTNDVSYAYLKSQNYSETAIKMIQLGEVELQKQFKNTQIVTEEGLKSSQKYARTWRRTVNELSTLVKKGIIEALPMIEKLVDSIRIFIDQNKEIIKSTIKTFFESLAIAIKIVYTVVRPLIFVFAKLAAGIDYITKGVGKYIVVVGMLVVALTALAAVIVVKVIAAFSALATALVFAIGAVSKVFGVLFKFISLFGKLIPLIKTLIGLLPTTVSLVKAMTLGLKNLALSAFGALKSIAGLSFSISKNLISALVKSTAAIVAMAVKTVAALIPAIVVASAATWGFVTALWATGIPQIILAITALTAAIVLMVKYWDKISAAVTTAWNAIKGFVAEFWNSGIDTWANIFYNIYESLGSVSGVWDSITSAIFKGINAVGEFASSITSKFSALMDNPFVKWFGKLFSSKKVVDIGLDAKTSGRVSTVASNVAQASASQVNNNSRSVVVNNNNTINTSAENGPAIASYLMQTNDLQRTGFGMSGAF